MVYFVDGHLEYLRTRGYAEPSPEDEASPVPWYLLKAPAELRTLDVVVAAGAPVLARRVRARPGQPRRPRGALSHEYRWFAEPVDLDAYPEYRRAIRQPMDFSTIRDAAYDDLDDFRADVALVFSNALAFNRDDSDVALAAVRLRDAFDALDFSDDEQSAPSGKRASRRRSFAVRRPGSQRLLVRLVPTAYLRTAHFEDLGQDMDGETALHKLNVVSYELDGATVLVEPINLWLADDVDFLVPRPLLADSLDALHSRPQFGVDFSQRTYDLVCAKAAHPTRAPGLPRWRALKVRPMAERNAEKLSRGWSSRRAKAKDVDARWLNPWDLRATADDLDALQPPPTHDDLPDSARDAVAAGTAAAAESTEEEKAEPDLADATTDPPERRSSSRVRRKAEEEAAAQAERERAAAAAARRAAAKPKAKTAAKAPAPAEDDRWTLAVDAFADGDDEALADDEGLGDFGQLTADEGSETILRVLDALQEVSTLTKPLFAAGPRGTDDEPAPLEKHDDDGPKGDSTKAAVEREPIEAPIEVSLDAVRAKLQRRAYRRPSAVYDDVRRIYVFTALALWSRNGKNIRGGETCLKPTVSRRERRTFDAKLACQLVVALFANELAKETAKKIAFTPASPWQSYVRQTQGIKTNTGVKIRENVKLAIAAARRDLAHDTVAVRAIVAELRLALVKYKGNAAGPCRETALSALDVYGGWHLGADATRAKDTVTYVKEGSKIVAQLAPEESNGPPGGGLKRLPAVPVEPGDRIIKRAAPGSTISSSGTVEAVHLEAPRKATVRFPDSGQVLVALKHAADFKVRHVALPSSARARLYGADRGASLGHKRKRGAGYGAQPAARRLRPDDDSDDQDHSDPKLLALRLSKSRILCAKDAVDFLDLVTAFNAGTRAAHAQPAVSTTIADKK